MRVEHDLDSFDEWQEERALIHVTWRPRAVIAGLYLYLQPKFNLASSTDGHKWLITTVMAWL